MERQLGYVDKDYLDVLRDRLRSHKERSYALLSLRDGARVLEVGCGPATDTIALARLVGPGGEVVGVDLDPEMVSEAKARADAAGLDGRVEHLHADAAALPFDDGTFDAARSERVFQHLSDARPVLAEMVRVTRCGGRVVVMDTDWATFSLDHPDYDLERRMIRLKCERTVRNGLAGRQLYRLFREAGLVELSVEPLPAWSHDLEFVRYSIGMDAMEATALAEGVVTAVELQRWREGLVARHEAGTLFGCGTMIVAAGTVP